MDTRIRTWVLPCSWICSNHWAIWPLFSRSMGWYQHPQHAVHEFLIHAGQCYNSKSGHTRIWTWVLPCSWVCSNHWAIWLLFSISMGWYQQIPDSYPAVVAPQTCKNSQACKITKVSYKLFWSHVFTDIYIKSNHLLWKDKHNTLLWWLAQFCGGSALRFAELHPQNVDSCPVTHWFTWDVSLT